MRKISKERIGQYLQTAFRIAVEYGDSYPVKEIIKEVEKRLKFNDYETEVLEKSGLRRWENYIYLWSIDTVKAGWLRKHKGVWYVTEDGKKALGIDPERFIETATAKYQEWARSRELVKEKEELESPQSFIATSYEQAQATAREKIKIFIKNLNPYNFQDLVAALFRGMGYYTPFVAPPGRDGGIDIVAYKDPMGAELPRIRVQVKHRPETKVSRSEVATLIGDLQREGYIGIIVSTGGFSPDALIEIRKASKHIEEINLDRFIDLWEEYYDKLSDEDKILLPLRKISFLAPEE